MAKFYPGDIVRAFETVVAEVICYNNEGIVMLKRHDGRRGPAFDGTKYQGLWAYPERVLEIVRETHRSLENE